jgi:hypothetical protein
MFRLSDEKRNAQSEVCEDPFSRVCTSVSFMNVSERAGKVVRCAR